MIYVNQIQCSFSVILNILSIIKLILICQNIFNNLVEWSNNLKGLIYLITS